jgi:CDP-glucose 4,6-dehydratase
MSTNFWPGKKVLVTGHTGFKGAWLSLILHQMNARVFGVSLKPQGEPNLYTLINHEIFESEEFLDLRDKVSTLRFIEYTKPDVIFHLAAQASVLEGYRDPELTWTSNVLSTLNILESLTNFASPVTVVVATTDKVYLNENQNRDFVEDDQLGGSDPYSTSKVAVEELVVSYRKVFAVRNLNVKIAVARAGNVIGGGDFMPHRIIPDAFRAIEADCALRLRNPEATRPWQHVLDPLVGYVALAEKLDLSASHEFQGAFNFSNPENFGISVRALLEHFPSELGLRLEIEDEYTRYSEAKFLNLDSSKAREMLNWTPKIGLPDAMKKTIEWQRNYLEGRNMKAFTVSQIKEYLEYESR